MTNQVTIIAGPNGVGKTTFARMFLQDHREYGFVSADDIVAVFTAEQGLFEDVRIRAGRLFFSRISQMISEKQNFAVETTLAGLGFQKIMRKFQQAGYGINLVFIFLETSAECSARIEVRVRNGGHGVSKIDIERRFYRSKKNFWNIYKYIVDKWHLVSNSGSDFREIAMGRQDLLKIIDDTALQDSLRDAHRR